MGFALKQHGLVAYDQESALVYVRILEDRSGEKLALVIVPSDNPGRSPINAAEALLAELSVFGPIRALVAFPEFDRDEWIELQPFDGATEPVRSSQEQVAALCGSHAELPPAHTCRCADLAPGDVLLQLVPEPEPERRPADDLRIVAVAALPWPHLPFGCRHSDRFDVLVQLYPPRARDTGVVGAHWHTTLTATDYRECRYHQPDWKTAAAVSVDIARAGIPATLDVLTSAIEQRDLPELTADAALSLFTDPVIWTPGTSHVTNGQHRVCALRASGAELAVIDTAGQPGPSVEPLRSADRAADEIGAYWAARPQTA